MPSLLTFISIDSSITPINTRYVTLLSTYIVKTPPAEVIFLSDFYYLYLHHTNFTGS